MEVKIKFEEYSKEKFTMNIAEAENKYSVISLPISELTTLLNQLQLIKKHTEDQ